MVYFFSKQRSPKHPVYTVLRDGVYILTITVTPMSTSPFKFNNDNNKFFANIEVSMRGPHGFLSAENWPLLHVTYFNLVI